MKPHWILWIKNATVKEVKEEKYKSGAKKVKQHVELFLEDPEAELKTLGKQVGLATNLGKDQQVILDHSSIKAM